MSSTTNILPVTLDGVIVGRVVFDEEGAHIHLTNEGAVKILDEHVRRKQIESLSLTSEPSPEQSARDLSLGHLRIVKGR